MEFTIQQAQSNLSELLAHVAAGEEVIIPDSEHHKLVAKVIAAMPEEPTNPHVRQMGWLEGVMQPPGPEFF